MRWPWVSRALLESERRQHATVVCLLEERARQLREDVSRERIRSGKLTAILIRLKRDGAVLLPAQALRQERKEPTAIEKAIDLNTRARQDPTLARHLLSYAAQQERAGVPEDEIIERISGWNMASHEDDAADSEEDAL